jgi:GT2 family glycosyltransferase
MAGACVMRVHAFRSVGGYDARLFIGGEEEPVALDLLSAGWAIVYAPRLTLHHHPCARDSALRVRLIARNRAWVAWARLPLAEALARTARAIGTFVAHRPPAREWQAFVQGIVRACRRRRVVPRFVRHWRRLANLHERV